MLPALRFLEESRSFAEGPPGVWMQVLAVSKYLHPHTLYQLLIKMLLRLALADLFPEHNVLLRAVAICERSRFQPLRYFGVLPGNPEMTLTEIPLTHTLPLTQGSTAISLVKA